MQDESLCKYIWKPDFNQGQILGAVLVTGKVYDLYYFTLITIHMNFAQT